MLQLLPFLNNGSTCTSTSYNVSGKIPVYKDCFVIIVNDLKLYILKILNSSRKKLISSRKNLNPSRKNLNPPEILQPFPKNFLTLRSQKFLNPPPKKKISQTSPPLKKFLNPT